MSEANTHDPKSIPPSVPMQKPAIITSKPRRRWIGKLISLGIVLAGVGVVLALGRMPGRPVETVTPVIEPVNVQVKVIQPRTETDTIELPGIVEPNAIVKVSAEVMGRVEKIALDEGQAIAKGDVILQLRTDLLEAERDRAKAQYECDKTDCERIEKLVQQKVSNLSELDQSRTKRDSSLAILKTAEAQLERATIRSPRSGILNRVPVNVGELMRPGDCAAHIVDIDTVKVAVQVPERDIAKITKGTQEIVRPESASEPATQAAGATSMPASSSAISQASGDCPAVTGTITYISEVADDVTHATRIELTVDNHERALRSGKVVRVCLTRGKLQNAIFVPLGAVIPLEEGYEAYVVENGKAQSRRITLGGFKGNEIQIVSGLKKGDKLILPGGNRYVSSGQDVRIQP